MAATIGAMLGAPIAATAIGAMSGELRFTAPPRLISDTAGPWMGGILTFDGKVAFGAVASSDFQFVQTHDSGETWTTIASSSSSASSNAYIPWQNNTYSLGGVCVAPSKSMPGLCNAYHNVGNASEVGSKAINATEIHSPATGIFTLDGGHIKQSIGANISFIGIPPPGIAHFRAQATANLLLYDGKTLLCTNIVTLPDDPTHRLSVMAFTSIDNGYTWRYRSIVASAMQVPYAHEGPSENALAHLANNSIICIMRVEGESGHHSPYISVVSDDDGHTWHSLRSLPHKAGCVRPRLLSLGADGLVLSGGRPNATSHDVLLWHNALGDGEEWIPYSVSYWHNLMTTNATWVWPPAATNYSRWPRYSTSYTSIVKTGVNEGFVVYEAAARGFAFPFRASSSSARARAGRGGKSEDQV